MYLPVDDPVTGPGFAEHRPHGPGHISHARCAGSNIPSAPLWEQWRGVYATRSHAELVSESRSLRQDEERLARSMVPDRMALGMIDMRLALIEEFLSSPRGLTF